MDSVQERKTKDFLHLVQVIEKDLDQRGAINTVVHISNNGMNPDYVLNAAITGKAMIKQ